MKKYFVTAAVVVAAVAGTVCYNSEKEEEMSDLAKANAKALADTDIRDIVEFCVWYPEKYCEYYVINQHGAVEGYSVWNMYQRFY